MTISNNVGTRKVLRSLTVLLALAFLALSVIVLLISSSLQLFFNFQTQRRLVAGQQQLIAREAASTVAGFVQEKFSELDVAVRLGIRISATPEEHKGVLDSLLGLDPAFRQVALLDLQGQELAQTSRLSQLATGRLTERIGSDALAQVREGNRQISPVYIDDVTSEPLVIIAVPVTNVFGDSQGMLLAEVNLKFMWDLVDQLQVGETGLAYVVDKQGDLIAFSDISRVLRGENVKYLGEVSEFVNNPALPDETSADTFKGITGINVMGTYAPLGTPDWAVMIELPLSEAYRDIIQGGVLSLIMIVVVAALAGMIGAYMARRLAAPLLSLTETATRIATGEVGLRAAAAGPSEVVSLAQAFNRMTEQVGGLLQTVQTRSAELEERGKELEASQRVTFAASEHATPDEMLDLVVNLIRDQFDLYHAQVYMVNEQEQAAVLRQSTGYAGRQLLQRKHHIPLDTTSLVTRAIHTGEAVLVDDVKADPTFLPNPLLPDTRSELVVPLKREGKVIGVLDAQDRSPGRFNPSTTALFQTMADQVTILFENSELLQRVTDQTEVMGIFTNQLRTAADIARRLGTILDPEQLLQEVVELIQSRFGLYHTHIYLLDEEAEILKLATGSGEVGRVLHERGHSILMSAEKSLVARAARSRGAVLIADTTLESDFMPNPLLPQTRSELAIPLVVGDKVLGVLDMQDDQAGRFTEAERDTFSTLAGLVATAIQNARLFAAQQEIEAEILQERNFSEAVVNSLPGNFYVIDDQANLARWNERFVAVSGYTPEELQQIGALGTIAEEDRAAVAEVIQQTFITGEESAIEAHVVTKSGERIPYYYTGMRAEIQGKAYIVGMGIDITDRLRAEAAVRESRQMLQTVMDSLPESIFWKDKDLVYLGCNTNFAQDAGVDSPEQVIGKTDHDMPWKDQVALYQADDRHVIETGESKVNFEEPQTTPDGTIKWLSTNKLPLYNEQGEAYAVLGAYADITERKQIETALQENEEKFRALYESTADALMLFTSDGFIDCNPRTLEIFGFESKEQFINTHPGQLSPPFQPDGQDSMSASQEQIKIAYQQGFNQFEWVHRRINGEDFPAEVLTSAFTIGGQQILQATVRDITDRKQAEAEIQKRASELQTVAEVGTAAATILEPDRLLAQVVQLTKTNFGLYHAHIYLIDEAGESLVLAAGAGEAGAQMKAQGWKIAADSETSLVARAFRTRQGVIVNDVRAAPDFLPNPLLPDTRAELAVPLIVGERILGVLDVQSDQVDHFTREDVAIQTTLAGQIAAALENARLFQETRELDRLKGEFLANMSHELRTPLNSIIGYIQLLLMDLEGEIPEDSYEDMKAVDTNSKHLLNLINDVLDLARIEAGRMELHMENITVPTLLDTVKSNNAGLFIDSALTLAIETEPDLPQIYADQIRITQVLNNLISNAFKFTETGGITVRAYRKDNEVCIAIEDTGIGIAEKDLETVFERFRQVDGSFTRRAEGTGLGLSITRLLVELHNGRLTVRSKFGEGSTFTVHLPAVE